MPVGEYRPVPKPSSHRRVRPTQRQIGEISQSVDRELKERSKGICELCGRAKATERAHLIGRKRINHKTTVLDLVHLCTSCHDWLDETPEGIRCRRMIAMLIDYAKRG
jgi:hypothetical protein